MANIWNGSKFFQIKMSNILRLAIVYDDQNSNDKR